MDKIIICLECGKEGKHVAKGLCGPCYHRGHYQKHREEILVANRQWLKKHREEYRAWKNQYNQENREKHKAYVKDWYKKNREKTLERARQWREGNPKRYAANQKRWRKENPERKKGIEARRQARKKELPSTLTEEQRKRLLAIGEGTYPGEKLHLDHFIPLKYGGGTTLANMHYIPANLNVFKKDRLPEEIYKQLELWQ